MGKTCKSSSKVYLDIVEQLKNMIEEDGLRPGDKIPSERELSERLQAGRSSVREALRALELLGLIETKRGEGTFVKDFQDHKLVEILGGFFLKEDKTKEKLTETKHCIELNCLQLAIKDASNSEIESIIQWVSNHEFDDFDFFQQIASVHDNRLMARIWMALGSYEKSVSPTTQVTTKEPYLLLLKNIKQRNEQKVVHIYVNDLRNMSRSD
ncbi:FadR/GntR family transcriptional regulator [Bacillus massiliigorillae]|uniref:FadR/GntR family transcriptional regulator n=1 Tax=Bacillus massiliigorillae TaxID=1243664 RepID=UPI0003A3BAC6|nr:GntR family transcriptional regulator [Bacillus massiliigorillae]